MNETREDVEQLNLLRIFWFVLAGLHALGGCIPIVHLAVGAALVGNSAGVFGTDTGAGAPPAAIGWFFIVIAVVAMLVIWTMAALTFLAGKRLGERRSHTFVLVLAVLLCLSVPLGTLLGVFTLIVIQRPTVKASFERNAGLSSAG